MGKIIVGQKSPVYVDMGVFTLVTEQPKASGVVPVVGDGVKEDELNGKTVEHSEQNDSAETAGEAAVTTAIAEPEKKWGGRPKKNQ